MSGFPTRFTRAHLGPKLVNTAPVENPENQVGDRQFNAAFWQTAGMNLVVPRVSLLARYVGGSFTYDHRGEAWNSDEAQAHPALARAAAGAYSYTFAASYLDEDGVAQATVLKGTRLSCHKALAVFNDRVEAHAFIDVGNPLVVQLRLWLANTGAAVDEPFWLEVF